MASPENLGVVLIKPLDQDHANSIQNRSQGEEHAEKQNPTHKYASLRLHVQTWKKQYRMQGCCTFVHMYIPTDLSKPQAQSKLDLHVEYSKTH